MKKLIYYIQQRLSLRLGLLIVIIIAVVFSLLFGYLFYRCKTFIQRAAIEHATQLLDNTAERINGIMDETETVTNFMAQTMPRNLSPDSLLAFTRRTVAENPFLTGFAISMEPFFFPEMGRYFSAYSLRHRSDDSERAQASGQGSSVESEGAQETVRGSGTESEGAQVSGRSSGKPFKDSITTVREGPFEYFEAVWYKTPRKLGKSVWTDAFDDYNEGTLSSPDIMTAYCCPMRDANGRYIGSITASLTLKWLSSMVTALKAYPHSSAIMLGRDGTYLVHPDTAKLFHESIFTDAAPEARRTIDMMGKAMIAGRSGMTETIVDGGDVFIFYRPIERTGWSIAIVCPKSDVYARFDRMIVIVWVIIVIGLMLLMLFCYQTVRRAVMPLNQLDKSANRIAEGRFDEPLPHSTRQDSVGRLTNSFITMQQSLAKMVNELRSVNEELEQQNEELAQAYQLKLETNKRKTAFIRDIYHEIRTPLNIIGGFSQVLTAGHQTMSEEEVSDITARMKESTKDISQLVNDLKAAVNGNR